MKTPILSTLLLSFLFFTSLLLQLSRSEKCNPTDKKVLLQIKKDLNNPYILSSWNPKDDCCDWYCVYCSETTNRIITLDIFSDDFPGQIPPSVGDLPYLETLIFRHLSNFTGTIPSAISKLKNLKSVRLSWTNLSGPVPDFFSTLPNLTYLDLSFNSLTGSIPPSLSKLKNLGALFLDRNKLSGKIPDSFGEFSREIFQVLDLSHNQLSGKIPNSLGNLNYVTIDLSRNKLEGDASMLFGSNKSLLFSLDLSRNLFEFNFTKLKFPKGLVRMDVSHNKIFGSLPATMAAFEWQLLNVSYNRLCGRIPTGGRLQSFDEYSYFHNRCLCGAPLPECK